MGWVERVIVADGVWLRPWGADDTEALAQIAEHSVEAFKLWLPGAWKDLEDPQRFVDHVATAFEDGSGFFYAILDGGLPVGQCSLHPQADGTAEVGYWVRTDHTGRGIATRSVVALTRAAFDTSAQELIIHCDEGNTRSAGVARRAGFTHVGTVELDTTLPRTSAQTGREMTWARRADGN
jgi:ribosomal-protein-serine acetyltransferase